MAEGENVHVAVRVRPFSRREQELRCSLVVGMDENTVTVAGGQHVKNYTFDHCYWSHDERSPSFATQEDIMTAIGEPILQKAMEGYNGCLFAYGQTGSGKTYSVFGREGEPGLLPHIVDYVYDKRAGLEASREHLRIWVSYTQIYNDMLHDLLAVGGNENKNLTIREYPKLGVQVPGLEQVACETAGDFHRLLSFGTKRRAMAATRVNDYSSRSHAIVTIRLQRVTGRRRSVLAEDAISWRQSLHARINIIDLAGSERQSKAETKGQLLKESCAINKGLSALALVIKELSERCAKDRKGSGQPMHTGISFRAAKLTWLLKDSLAGNSKTHMLANISPASESVSETVSTLRFASSVKTIRTKAVQNKQAEGDVIRNLKEELTMLRTKLQETDCDKMRLQEQELKAMLKDYEVQLKNAKHFEVLRKQAMADMALSQEEIDNAFGMDKMTPCLLNMSSDPTLAGCLLYFVPEGQRRTIGAAADNSICIEGIGIPAHLCTIENMHNKVLTLQKCGKEGRVVINGTLLQPDFPRQLENGQIVRLGRTVSLRVSLPMGALEKGQKPLQLHESTDLLIQSLEDEHDGIEESPSWIALRDYLDQVVQLMPREEAEALICDVKQAVAMADEASEITDVCRPQSGIRFEVRLTSGSPPSIVICLLQAAGGENPSQAGLPVCHWSLQQARVRLDRMQDCYCAMRLTCRGARREWDDLEDPWVVMNPDEILSQMNDLQVRLEDQEQSLSKEEVRREANMKRGLLLWRGTRIAEDLHVYFGAWARLTKPIVRSSLRRRAASSRDDSASPLATSLLQGRGAADGDGPSYRLTRQSRRSFSGATPQSRPSGAQAPSRKSGATSISSQASTGSISPTMASRTSLTPTQANSDDETDAFKVMMHRKSSTDKTSEVDNMLRVERAAIADEMLEINKEKKVLEDEMSAVKGQYERLQQEKDLIEKEVHAMADEKKLKTMTMQKFRSLYDQTIKEQEEELSAKAAEHARERMQLEEGIEKFRKAVADQQKIIDKWEADKAVSRAECERIAKEKATMLNEMEQIRREAEQSLANVRGKDESKAGEPSQEEGSGQDRKMATTTPEVLEALSAPRGPREEHPPRDFEQSLPSTTCDMERCAERSAPPPPFVRSYTASTLVGRSITPGIAAAHRSIHEYSSPSLASSAANATASQATAWPFVAPPRQQSPNRSPLPGAERRPIATAQAAGPASLRLSRGAMPLTVVVPPAAREARASSPPPLLQALGRSPTSPIAQRRSISPGHPVYRVVDPLSPYMHVGTSLSVLPVHAGGQQPPPVQLPACPGMASPVRRTVPAQMVHNRLLTRSNTADATNFMTAGPLQGAQAPIQSPPAGPMRSPVLLSRTPLRSPAVSPPVVSRSLEGASPPASAGYMSIPQSMVKSVVELAEPGRMDGKSPRYRAVMYQPAFAPPGSPQGAEMMNLPPGWGLVRSKDGVMWVQLLDDEPAPRRSSFVLAGTDSFQACAAGVQEFGG
eukprot:TRINITY_DN29123_c0_g1_i1.p1 TRINITY_DN29123_c0_g1~~TRINITY_DN29123_c0_g1_i1.p1  ORF type:complete len:1488 (-),score=335.06 TRINITY_DN29123_c0_g1_i1:297-4760(-)